MLLENDMVAEIVGRMVNYQRQGRIVIYFDGVTFGSWTLPTKEWSAYRSSHKVTSDLTRANTIKVIAGMSW